MLTARNSPIAYVHSLAWAEMYLLLAGLVHNFDFEFPDATAADFEFESDRFTIGTKAGCNLMARVISRWTDLEVVPKFSFTPN